MNRGGVGTRVRVIPHSLDIEKQPTLNWIPQNPGPQKYHRYPETYPSDVRGLISSWAEAAVADRHVITSDPLVDATLQEGSLGAGAGLGR